MLCKGRVFALHNEPDVKRVWLPDSNAPGLAMARAFGDFCLKDFGLISVPDVSYRRLTEKDEFVVLATDGVRHQCAYIIFPTTYLFLTSLMMVIKRTDIYSLIPKHIVVFLCSSLQ
jgi:hypothetical protein